MKRHAWGLTLALTIALLVGGALFLYLTGFFQAIGSMEDMRSYIERFTPYTHLVYFLVQLASVVIAPIPSNITALAGGVLFGTWLSFFLTALAVVSGSMLVFALARGLGRSLPWPEGWAAPSWTGSSAKKSRKNTWMSSGASGIFSWPWFFSSPSSRTT